MKKSLHTLRPAALIGIGLALALASAAVSYHPPVSANPGSRILPIQATVTPSVQDASEIGSTDGIVLLGIIIVLIVIIPILARRTTWSNN